MYDPEYKKQAGRWIFLIFIPAIVLLATMFLDNIFDFPEYYVLYFFDIVVFGPFFLASVLVLSLMIIRLWKEKYSILQRIGLLTVFSLLLIPYMLYSFLIVCMIIVFFV